MDYFRELLKKGDKEILFKYAIDLENERPSHAANSAFTGNLIFLILCATFMKLTLSPVLIFVGALVGSAALSYLITKAIQETSTLFTNKRYKALYDRLVKAEATLAKYGDDSKKNP